MSKTIHNARVRLRADALNMLSVALFAGSLLVLVYSPLALLPRSLAAIILLVVSILLHLAARHVITKLEP